jgi:hypothetical protein
MTLAGMPGELRRARLLDQRDAAGAVDGAHSQGAVAAGARENDADRLVALVIGQGAQESVDRHALAAWHLRHGNPQLAVRDGHLTVGGNDVHAIGAHRHAIFGLDDRHRRRALQDLGQQAGMAGIEMRHQHESQAAVVWQMVKKLLERLQPAGRGTDADDRKARAFDVLWALGGRWLVYFRWPRGRCGIGFVLAHGDASAASLSR